MGAPGSGNGLTVTKVVPSQKLDLTKVVSDAGQGTLEKIKIAVGWDPNASVGDNFDADVTVILAGDDEKCPQANVCYFGQLTAGDGSAVHSGDNLTGEGDGDDEVINVDLNKVPSDVQKIIVYVTIFQGKERGQNFGMLNNAFIRVDNGATGEALAKMELDFDASSSVTMRFATFIRRPDSWFMQGEKTDFAGGIQEIVAAHVK